MPEAALPAPSDLLHYWRASLADGQLPSLPEKAPRRPVDWSRVCTGRLEAETVTTLLSDWKSTGVGKAGRTGNRADEQEMPTSVPVLLAPVVLIPQHQHGTSGRRAAKPYAPLIVPAVLAATGALTFDPSKHQPWFCRSALDPSAAPEPPVGSLDAFDTFRSQTPCPEDADWTKLISYTEALCKAVTGSALADVTLEGYERGPALVVAAIPPASPSRHLITLTDAFEADDTSLPPTFLSACRPGPQRPQLTPADRWKASARHSGQMGADYPLADRQRDAVHHLSACTDGDILPVNGPPGTGKTTLLQSIVATMVVEAALTEAEPPVIVITSTNNQAVTNVIDSFAKVEPPAHRQDDPLEGRWLPGVKSFALYLPAASKEVDTTRYHVATLPEYHNKLGGMPADMLQSDAVDRAEAAFLSAAQAAFNTPFSTLSDVRNALSEALAKGAAQLEACTALAGALQSHRTAHPGHSVASFASWVAAEAQTAESHITSLQQSEDKAHKTAAAARSHWRAADAAVSQGLQELFPTGFLGWVLGFLPSVRAGRWERCRRHCRTVGIEDGPFASVMVPATFTGLRPYLDDHLRTLRKQADSADLEAKGNSARESIASLRARIEALTTEAAAWQQAEDAWATIAEELHTAANGIGAVRGISRDILIAEPDAAESLLDVTLRHDLFLLATHYWEARWLQTVRALEEKTTDLLAAVSKKSRLDTETRWRLMACLTPCFVSTLFMLPKHLQYYDSKGANKNPPLTNFVDLLIVDEAGQVPAEIGAIGLSLGRKALVVGDIHQIEPVWSIGQHIDDGNLRRYGLLDQTNTLDSAGCRASNGSLMRIARHTSAFAGDTPTDPGIFLTEHRRCQTPIITVCNDLVYAGRLIPRTPALSAPILPPLGWANVRSPSGRRGGSRFNAGEAESIAEWLARRQSELESHYGKPLAELVGIVTPFGAQKSELRSALSRYGIKGDLTVGTVHALQGAEREIVIFSPVHTAEDGGQPFFDRGPNMVNVAVSRAKHSFLVFGDMRMFLSERATEKVPSGILAKHLFDNPDAEILDALTRPAFLFDDAAAHTTQINSLEDHRRTLKEALEQSTHKILIVSPCLSGLAVTADKIPALVVAACDRNVSVTVVFDPQQNKNEKKRNCDTAISLLTKAGAKVLPYDRVHYKTLAVDDRWIVDGSFNWFGAVRNPNHEFSRRERSMRYKGPTAGALIENAWRDLDV